MLNRKSKHRRNFLLGSLTGLFSYLLMGKFSLSDSSKTDKKYPTYQSIIDEIGQEAKAVVDIRVYNMVQRSGEKIHFDDLDWCENTSMMGINRKYEESGDIVGIQFIQKGAFACWRYQFRNIKSKESWSKELSRGKIISLKTRSFHSIRTDQSGKKYLYELSLGLS